MGRALWKGSLGFGLVNVPVEVHTAVREDAARVKFNMLHKDCAQQINYIKRCSDPKHAKTELQESDIVKGYQYEKGKFLVMEDADFAAAALEATKQVELTAFVRESEIDPRYFEKPYFLLPQKGGEKGYALLREAVRKTGMVGIGQVSLKKNAMHLAALKVVGDSLVLCMMRYADELVDPNDITFPDATLVKPQELTLAVQLVSTLAAPFQPETFSDQYSENLRQIIAKKAKGEKIELDEPEAPEATNVDALLSKLQESLSKPKAPKKKKN